MEDQRPSIPPPELLISANGSGDQVAAYIGWPVIVRTSLLHPRAFADKVPIGGAAQEAPLHAPMILCGKDLPWTNAVRLEVTDASGRIVALPFALASAPSGLLALDRNTPAGLDWLLGPKQTRGLTEGDYKLEAVLDTTACDPKVLLKSDPKLLSKSGIKMVVDPNRPNYGQNFGGGFWKGKVRSKPVTLQIRKAPSPLSADLEEQRLLSLAHHALLAKEPKQAAACIDQLLAMQPMSIYGLEAKGDLLAAAGRTSEAIRSYSRAITEFYERNPKPQEPPVSLLLKRDGLLDQKLLRRRDGPGTRHSK
jgi:hypothetical protein